MAIGIDFGTSNCAVAYMSKDGPIQIPLEGQSTTMPSVVWVPKERFPSGEVDEIELDRRTTAEVARQTSTRNSLEAELEKISAGARGHQAIQRKLAVNDQSPSEVRSLIESVMRRELRQSEERQFRVMNMEQALKQGLALSFGSRAIHFRDHDVDDGFFATSPKTFLASKLSADKKKVFREIVKSLFAHLKEKAELELGGVISKCVVGRPINFHGLGSNEQALSLIVSSAKSAGFEKVEFQYEPVAAAYDLEWDLNEDRCVLVIDVGGGTTDCSAIEIGPSFRQSIVRNSSTHAHAGDRIGGRDFDFDLAIGAIMPQFGMGEAGRNGSGFVFPNHVYSAAANVHDLPKHSAFLNRDLVPCSHLTHKTARLVKLHEGRLTHRLNSSVERAKIGLSAKSRIELPLSYIASGLSITVDRDQVSEHFSRRTERVLRLAKEAASRSRKSIDSVLLTGGMSQYPSIKDAVEREFAGLQFFEPDHFGNVARGLAIHAHKTFG